jgi:acyl carrier protein
MTSKTPICPVWSGPGDGTALDKSLCSEKIYLTFFEYFLFQGRFRMSESTFEVVRRVLVSQLSIDESEVTPDASINDDLGADSLDAVELIMSLEEEFDLTIETTRTESLATVSDVVSLIDSLKA